MTDELIDLHLDAVLRASGSALKHYTMQKTIEDMRKAMREAMAQSTPAKGSELESIRSQMKYPVAWVFRKGLIKKINWIKPCLNDPLKHGWEPLYAIKPNKG